MPVAKVRILRDHVHFTFRIKPFANPQPINAFDILINATKERHLPVFDYHKNQRQMIN